MKRNAVAGLILITAIAAAVIFACCIDKETPVSTPTPTITPTTLTPLIEPKVLGSDDFGYWSWEPDVESETPRWPKVLPPENLTENFILAGFAGDEDDITCSEWKTDCHSEPTCAKHSYSAKASEGFGWAGRLWVDVMCPKYSVGVNLRRVNKLTFWSKGEKGGEKVEFRVGCTKGVPPQPAISTGIITLEHTWQQYSIDLKNKDRLGHVFCGFSWITNKSLNPSGCTFYLDDMIYE